jgi:hypothetical protein
VQTPDDEPGFQYDPDIKRQECRKAIIHIIKTKRRFVLRNSALKPRYSSIQMG